MSGIESNAPTEKPLNPEALYNPEYEKRKLEKEVDESKLPGEWFRFEKSGVIVGCDKRDGLYVRTLSSNRHLEEDVATMCGGDDKPETILTAVEQGEVIKTALVSVIRDYGKFINPDEIQRVFPGLVLEDLESYNISLARVRVFILGSADYDVVRLAAVNPKNSAKEGWQISNGVALQARKVDYSKYYNNRNSYLISTITPDDEVDIVLVREAPSWGNDHEGQDSRASVEQIKRETTETLRHEMLHVLHVGYGFDHAIMEGITAYYSRYMGESSYPITGLFGLEANRDIEPGPALINDVVKICVKAGVSEEDIHKALLASDPKASILMRSVLQREVGKAFADDFMVYGFGNISTAEETMFKRFRELYDRKHI